MFSFNRRGMLFVSALMLFAISTAVQAETEPLVFGSDATYTKDLKNAIAFPHQIEKVLHNHAPVMMIGRDGKHAISALDLMSRVFVSNKFADAKNPDDKLILAMSGITLSGTLKYNEIYTHPKGYVIHVKASGGDIALFFQGYGIGAVEEIKSEILKAMEVAEAGPARIYDFVFPQAQAEEPALCGGPIQPASGSGSTNASLLQKVWGCTKGAVGGAWDSTAGASWSVVKGAIHPIETFDKASAAVSNISAMMSDMQGAFGQLKTAYNALPDDVKWKLGCEMVSAIGTTGLIAYFSAGAGSPLLVRTIAQALTKIGGALPAGSAVAAQTLALAGKMTSQAAKVAEIRSLIAQGADGKQFIDKVEKFDYVVSNVNRTHTDLYFASRVPKMRGSGGWPASPIIDDLSESAAFDKAVKTRDALQDSEPDFMRAVYTAREAKRDLQMTTDPEVRARILKELQASQKLSPAQKAAATAYISASGCNLASKMNDSVNESGSSSTTR